MPRARTAVRPYELVISCEHGGNRIPARYRAFFARAGEALAGHRGYDPGALSLAREFARALRARLFYSTVSRLLVELNRSLGHRQSFSRWLPRSLREEVVQRHYLPYRASVEGYIARAIRGRRRVIHLSCHSFTPRLAGLERRADIGLLYDPRRSGERRLCQAWKAALGQHGVFRVRLNYPYRGFADGFTSHLRERFGPRAYLGIELEVNQRIALGDPARWRALRRRLVQSFAQVMA